MQLFGERYGNLNGASVRSTTIAKAFHWNGGTIASPSSRNPWDLGTQYVVCTVVRRFSTTPLDTRYNLSLLRPNTPEDLTELREFSLSIMSDPLTQVSQEETSRYLTTMPRTDLTMVQKFWRFLIGYNNPDSEVLAYKFMCMICERLENRDLVDAFGIDDGFNMRAYFAALHAWLLHKRLILEPMLGMLVDQELFPQLFDFMEHWMVLKETPAQRFQAELKRVRTYLMAMMVCLDDALGRTDILPARIHEALFMHIYSTEGFLSDDPRITLLTKYVMRQLVHLLQMDREHFLNAEFVWAPMMAPQHGLYIDSPLIPALAYRPLYGGYFPPPEMRRRLAARKRFRLPGQYFTHAPGINFVELLETTAPPVSRENVLEQIEDAKAAMKKMNEGRAEITTGLYKSKGQVLRSKPFLEIGSK